jgi:hypothetical protein
MCMTANVGRMSNEQVSHFIIVMGKSIAISTSKIKKITAIRKNRKENSSRADLFGSNPHSKEELFLRSSIASLTIMLLGI